MCKCDRRICSSNVQNANPESRDSRLDAPVAPEKRRLPHSHRFHLKIRYGTTAAASIATTAIG